MTTFALPKGNTPDKGTDTAQKTDQSTDPSKGYLGHRQDIGREFLEKTREKASNIANQVTESARELARGAANFGLTGLGMVINLPKDLKALGKSIKAGILRFCEKVGQKVEQFETKTEELADRIQTAVKEKRDGAIEMGQKAIQALHSGYEKKKAEIKQGFQDMRESVRDVYANKRLDAAAKYREKLYDQTLEAIENSPLDTGERDTLIDKLHFRLSRIEKAIAAAGESPQARAEKSEELVRAGALKEVVLAVDAEIQVAETRSLAQQLAQQEEEASRAGKKADSALANILGEGFDIV